MQRNRISTFGFSGLLILSMAAALAACDRDPLAREVLSRRARATAPAAASLARPQPIHHALSADTGGLGAAEPALAARTELRAEDEDDRGAEESDPRIRQGFKIAPVPLNLKNKIHALVGLGSYLVNAGSCNDCHTGGRPPNFNFAAGGNPYFGQPKKVNPETYLSGGQDFGPVGAPPSPNIISRNLTPSTKTGLPEGDHTFEQFLTILRTGKDLDHLHPNCSATTTTNCFPADPSNPVEGDLLQIMPWPNFQDLTDHDIRAIYEYLRAIPCIQGIYPGEPADRCQ